MKLIFAETGQETIIDDNSCSTLSRLKHYLYTVTGIPIDQQILLSTSGIQQKDVNYSTTHPDDTLILFNRQHLERNNNQQQNDTDSSFKHLVDKRMPSVDGLERLTDLHNTLDTQVEIYRRYKQQQQQQPKWTFSEYKDYYKQLVKHMRLSADVILEVAQRHSKLANTMIQELKTQSVALNAALINFENHIKTTYSSQSKLERIAKRKLAKHTDSVADIDKDIAFMHKIQLHPHIQTQLGRSTSFLVDCFSVSPMEALKSQLQKDHYRLEAKTNKLTTKMGDIYQESSHISIQRSGSTAVVNKVMRTLGDIQTYLSLINNLCLHLQQRWESRNLDDLNDSGGDPADEWMIAIVDTTHSTNNNDDDDLDNNLETNDFMISDDPDNKKNYMTENNDEDTKTDDDTDNNNSPMGSTIKRTQLQELCDDKLMQRLFLYESQLRNSINVIMEEKRNAMFNFFQCLQTISSLEESISNLFLCLQQLGGDIKHLGKRIDQLETLSKGIIEGYGMMLIELWRRDQYRQIVTKNAELLKDLFSNFASSEQRYRDQFQADLWMTSDMNTLLFDNKGKIKEDTCIIPFIWKEFTKEEQSCTTTSLGIELLPNGRHQQSNYDFPMESNLLICKKDVQDFLDLMQSYYTFQGIQGKQDERPTNINTILQRLSGKLDRESKRLTHGLVKLGLPNNKAKKERQSEIPSFAISSTSSSPPISTTSTTSATSTSSITPTMATATSTQVQPSFNLPFVPSPAKKGWSSSIYAQIQQQQELKTRVETLESQLRRDQHLFEKQRSVLLQEIKMKDTLLLEKDQQWESRWTTKVQQLEEQLDQERQKHENDILDWKKRYEEALDIEQQKHHRRLAYFHERLTAKNMEYAELERQLTTQSAPSSPTQPYYNSLQEQSPRYQRSASLDATAMGTGWMNRPIMRMVRSATRRTSGSIYQQQLQRQNDDDDVIHKNDMYIKEIQDLTLRHQASLDNMMAEYEENRMELQAQHDQEREVWKIKHTAELEEACKRLAQEHEMILEGINTSWQQRWDNLMTQNKMEQAALEQKWDQRLKSEKASWQEQQKKEYAGLKKELLWSKGELSMVLKEHENATRLAKELNLVIDHTIDPDELLKYTLTGLLETGIQNAARLHSQQYLDEKANESASPFGFMNVSFF